AARDRHGRPARDRPDRGRRRRAGRGGDGRDCRRWDRGAPDALGGGQGGRSRRARPRDPPPAEAQGCGEGLGKEGSDGNRQQAECGARLADLAGRKARREEEGEGGRPDGRGRQAEQAGDRRRRRGGARRPALLAEGEAERRGRRKRGVRLAPRPAPRSPRRGTAFGGCQPQPFRTRCGLVRTTRASAAAMDRTPMPDGFGVARASVTYGKRPTTALEYVPPRDPREHALAELVAEVLDLNRVGAKDDLFELGLDALGIDQLLVAVHGQL